MTLKNQIDRFSQNEENFNALITGSAGTTVDLGEAGIVKSVATVIGEIAPGVDKGTWSAATAYIINDIALESGAYYRCRENHTSGTFATDLAAGKWRLNQGGDSTILTHRGRALDDAFTARFSTVTAMIADVNLVVGDVVETFANQNGAAVNQEWEIVPNLTGTPDGGSYIDLTGSGLQAKQIFPDRVTPEHFGAFGDGINDDGAYINNALVAIDTVYDYDKVRLISSVSVTLNSNNRLIGNSTYTLAAASTLLQQILCQNIDNFRVIGLKLTGNAKQSSGDPQDGDKGIYIVNCTNSYVFDVKTSNTWAWGIIQTTNCDNVVFEKCVCDESKNQSAIAVTNNSKNAKVIDSIGKNTGLYGLEIENGCDTVHVVRHTAYNAVSGINIAANCKNVFINGGKLTYNDNYNLVPPNPGPAIGGWGVRALDGCQNIHIFDVEILENTMRPCIEILGCKDVHIKHNILKKGNAATNIDGDAISLQQEGVIYVADFNGGAELSDRVYIDDNSIDCNGTTTAIFCRQTPIISGSFVNNDIANPTAKIIDMRLHGPSNNNKITTAYAATSGNDFVSAESNPAALRLEGGAGVAVAAKWRPDRDVVVIGYSYNVSLSAITPTCQIIPEINGVNDTNGLITPTVAGDVYSISWARNDVIAAGTQCKFKLLTTTGDAQEFFTAYVHYIEIV